MSRPGRITLTCCRCGARRGFPSGEVDPTVAFLCDRCDCDLIMWVESTRCRLTDAALLSRFLEMCPLGVTPRPPER